LDSNKAVSNKAVSNKAVNSREANSKAVNSKAVGNPQTRLVPATKMAGCAAVTVIPEARSAAGAISKVI
jgi:hypothetical protein